jgi:hypothetical protein
MGFEYVLGATPAVESANYGWSFLIFWSVEVAHSNLEPLTLLWFSLTVHYLRCCWGDFLPSNIQKIIFNPIFVGIRKVSNSSAGKGSWLSCIENFKNFTVEEIHERVSGSKFEFATWIWVPSRKWKSVNCKLADSTTGVASNTYPKCICSICTWSEKLQLKPRVASQRCLDLSYILVL